MKKKKIKILMRVIFYLAIFGLFAGLIIFLNVSSQRANTEEVAWEAEKLENVPQGWEKVAENEALELYFEPSKVQILVKDKKTGTEWRSNPANAEEDTIAFGGNKLLLQSVLNITYVDEQSSYYTVNSFAGSTQDSAYSYEYQDNGIYVNLGFEKQGFEIPCFFGIDGDHFVARIFNDQIKQHGNLQITSISLLPFFGAGSVEDEGYMMVPDGSGALIYYNNQKQSYQSYSQKVYGRDLALNVKSNLTVTQNATMPVFGVKKNDDAMLAIITKGEYQAEIKAEVSGKLTGSNTVYSNIIYIQSESNTLLENSASEQTTVMLSEQQNQFPCYEVSYYFLEKNADYSEMAARYRQFLVEEKGMETQETHEQKRMNLAFIGGAEVRKTLLGVPYHAVEALTPFDELSKTALALQSLVGDSFQISMQYMEKGGTESKLPTKLTYASALGGQKGYQKMAQFLEEAGISFYPVYDPVSVKKAGNGYHFSDGARNVTRSMAYQYDFYPTSGTRDTSTAYYLISPKHVEDIMDGLLESAQKKGVENLGLTGITDSIYSDFRSNGSSANETGAYWEDALNKAADSTQKLLLQGAYAYAFPYADVITEVPIYSSWYDVEDETIPFYEMAVSGYVALYSEPVNKNGNVREMLLKAVEYGVSPTFQLMTAQSSVLQDTEHQKYYYLAWEDWQDTVLEELQELEVLDDVYGQEIMSHRKVQEDVYASTYLDGTVVYVNYSDREVVVEDVRIPAMGFAKKGGDE